MLIKNKKYQVLFKQKFVDGKYSGLSIVKEQQNLTHTDISDLRLSERMVKSDKQGRKYVVKILEIKETIAHID